MNLHLLGGKHLMNCKNLRISLKIFILISVAILSTVSLMCGSQTSEEYCTSHQCFAVPPTGQTRCYYDYIWFDCPASRSDPYWGQDAQFPKARTLTCSGGPCSTSAAVENEIVTDSLIGLVWQRALPSVYDGCTKGATEGSLCNWQEAKNYCENLEYGGQNDWRLPNIFELQSIVDHQRCEPAIDSTVFPDTTSSDTWSSSSHLIKFRYEDTDSAWCISYTEGTTCRRIKSSHEKYYGGNTRCVRGGPQYTQPIINRYIIAESVSGQKVVTDSITGIMWQGNYIADKTWQEALNYCALLTYGGYSDWRLPNKNELLSLFNSFKRSPASDFPDMQQDVHEFWSSTTKAHYTVHAWTGDFLYGYASSSAKTDKQNVRCVRLGP